VTRRPSASASTPWPATASKFSTRARQRVLARALDRRGEAQKLVRVEAFGGEHVCHVGPPFRYRARLVEHDRLNLLDGLKRLAAAYEHACLCAAPRADHDGSRRREPERAGAGDDEHGDGVDERRREPRALGGGDEPDDEGNNRDADDRGREVAAYRVGESRDWRAAALRLLDHAYDLLQDRVAPDARRAEGEAARAVDGRAHDLVARPLLDGHALARQHRFVN
jgi:hypothetical protein